MTVGNLGLSDQEDEPAVIFMQALSDGFNPANPAVEARGKAQLAAQGKILLDCLVNGTGAQAATKDLVVFEKPAKEPLLPSTRQACMGARRQADFRRARAGR